jgi:hypothetical protein
MGNELQRPHDHAPRERSACHFVTVVDGGIAPPVSRSLPVSGADRSVEVDSYSYFGGGRYVS